MISCFLNCLLNYLSLTLLHAFIKYIYIYIFVDNIKIKIYSKVNRYILYYIGIDARLLTISLYKNCC